MAYIGSRPDNVISRNAQNEYNYTATGGQTTFTGADSNNNTLSYTPGNIEVYFNGARLEESDFTATNGTSIVLANAAVVNDELSIVAVNVFEVADVVPASTGGTFQGGIAVQGGVNVAGHILPDTNITYDLGSTTQRFRDLYLSGNSIQLGTRTISQDNVPDVNLAIAPEVLTIDVAAPAAGQDTQWLWNWLTSSLPYARRAITNSNELNVPLYKQGTYTVNNFAKTQYGSMTQAHTMHFKWIDGAGTQNNISWVTDQGTFTDSHPDINGGADTTVQRLSISVPSTITPPTLTAPSVTYTVTNSGSGSYTFSGPRDGNNPNIGPLRRGGTYTFNISATGHPFYLTTDNGTNFSAGTYFGEYTSGVTGSRTDSGTLTFVVPANAPDTLYYQCGNHSSMRGAITVKDLAVETNINGNYVVYAQHTQEGHKTPVELRPIPSLVNQMCLVYDSSVNKFVPQDLATYVENTPSFENKIREVAGTAELVVEDGSAVVAKVNVYADSTYLPLTDNNAGDQAFATDTDKLYIWDGSAWQLAGAANTGELPEGTNLYYTDARVASYLSSNDFDTATNIVASITDSAPSTLDTLNELAAALGDDANFSTTVTNSIATKLSLAGGTMTGNLNIDVADLFVKDTTGGAQGQVQIGAGTVQGFINIQKGDGTRTVQLFSDGTSYLTGGNVGIGTDSPPNLLTVDTNAAATTSDSISVRNRGISATGHTVGLRFQYNSAVPSAIRTVNTDISSGAGRLGLFTSPDGTAGNLVERLTILPNGFVGIGNAGTNPGNPLHINHNGAPSGVVAKIQSNGNPWLQQSGASSSWQIGATSKGWELYNDNTNAYRIAVQTDGDVGIGTRDPTAKLEVANAAGGATVFINTTQAWTAANLSEFSHTPLVINSRASGAQLRFSGATDYVSIQSLTSDLSTAKKISLNPYGGNVGIGVTDPNFKLHVNKGSNTYEPSSGINENVVGFQTSYDTAGSQLLTFSRLDGNWLDGITGSDSAFGWLWNYQTNTRAGIVYDHRSTEKFQIFSSYGSISFLTPDALDGNATPNDSNMNERLQIHPGGAIGMGVTPYTNTKLTLGGTTASYNATLMFDNNTSGGAEFFMVATDNTWSVGANKFIMGHGAPSSSNVDLEIDSAGYIHTTKERLSVGANYNATTGKRGLRVGRTVINWFNYGSQSSSRYLHIKTNLVNQTGSNPQPTMSMFHIRGYTYSAHNIDSMLGFHNWSGSYYNTAYTNNGHSTVVSSSWAPYRSTDNKVVIVLDLGVNTYAGVSIDYMQNYEYTWRDVEVSAYTRSTNTSGVY